MATVTDDRPGLFAPAGGFPPDVVRFCTEECGRQQSGAVSVWWMLRGWAWLEHDQPPLTVEAILHLAWLIEPVRNVNGFRRVNVRVGLDPIRVAWREVPGAMDRMLAAVDAAHDPDSWFREYEEIHPFRDGNGRTGALWWNYLHRLPGSPIFVRTLQRPPDFWPVPAGVVRTWDADSQARSGYVPADHAYGLEPS